MTKLLKIATRRSPLAIWQAEYVKLRLESIHQGLQVELVKMTTEGDKALNMPLTKIGGKGLFIKELEQGMLTGTADIAVHSIKDVPMQLPEKFKLAAICKRAEPFDALVSNMYNSLEELPVNAIVGTSSLRRKCQLLNLYPGLQVVDLRGNVNTRLSKLDNGEYDAIILASAGLTRLGFENRIKQKINPNIILPAVGQGAVGIETLADDKEIISLVTPLNHIDSQVRVSAERAMNLELEGGCQVPIGGFATLDNEEIHLRALVGSADGSRIIKSDIKGPENDAEKLGVELALELLSIGADKILKEI